MRDENNEATRRVSRSPRYHRGDLAISVNSRRLVKFPTRIEEKRKYRSPNIVDKEKKKRKKEKQKEKKRRNFRSQSELKTHLQVKSRTISVFDAAGRVQDAGQCHEIKRRDCWRRSCRTFSNRPSLLRRFPLDVCTFVATWLKTEKTGQSFRNDNTHALSQCPDPSEFFKGSLR